MVRFMNVTFKPNPVNLSEENPSQNVSVTANVSDADMVIMDGIELRPVYRDTWVASFTVDSKSYPQGSHKVSKRFEAMGRRGHAMYESSFDVITEAAQTPPVITNVNLDPNPVILSENNPTVNVNVEVNATDSDSVSLDGKMMSGVAPNTWVGTKTISMSSYSQSKVINLTIQASGRGGNATHLEELTITVASYETVETENVNSISLTANINANVIEDRGNYGLAGGGFDITRGKDFNVSYNLPTGSLNLPVGTINAVLPDGRSGGFFEPIMSVSVDRLGNLTSSITMNGNDVVASVEENPLLAQEVIWDTENRASTVTSTSDDKLSSVVNANDVANHYASQLQSITDSYNFNVLQYWNFDIKAIPATSDSIVSSYAAINGRTAQNMFEDGEHIVLETTYPYSVTITDMNGVEQTIVSNTEIHAIVYHDGKAPPLQ